MDIKILERLFFILIKEGTNCTSFEFDMIVEKAKEVFAIGDHAEGNILPSRQVIRIAIDINKSPDRLPTEFPISKRLPVIRCEEWGMGR